VKTYHRSADSVLATEYGCRIWLKHIPFCARKLALSTYTNIHSTYKMVVFPKRIPFSTYFIQKIRSVARTDSAERRYADCEHCFLVACALCALRAK
jgi:hypothetical protein